MKRSKGKKMKDKLDATVGSQIMLTHVLGTDDHDIIVDMSVISEAFAQAYNQVHAGSGYEVTSVELKREVDIPEDDGKDEDGDDVDNVEIVAVARGRRSRYVFSRYFWTNINYHCRLCSDDSSYMPPLELLANGTTHKAFQDIFLHFLKESGLPEYKDVRSCSISFSYSTADHELEAVTLEQ